MASVPISKAGSLGSQRVNRSSVQVSPMEFSESGVLGLVWGAGVVGSFFCSVGMCPFNEF